MIYLKNNTETQAIYIPRQTVLGGGYIPSTKAYDKGYNDGLEVGKEQQKDKLSNLNVTANGQYEREDGWNVVNVDVPDLNGSYNEGYEQGKTDGIDEQKGKLESISITENGTYNKEDGYNHIEVNVPSYEQGQADMAAKARVLNVTENGTYLSKFSDSIIPTVTGVYANGTDFYSYALISNIIYSTGIIPNQNTRLEFWFKPYGTEYENWEIIIGSQRGDDTSDTFQVRRYSSSTNFVAEIGTSEVSFTMSENEWHHIIMSVADGFVLDGTKIGDFTENMTESNTPLQIGGSINFNGQRTEEGYYGMIKIDDNIIIPTENGFKNVTTDQILQILKDGSYTFTENLPIYAEGELYKTINVNVPTAQEQSFNYDITAFTYKVYGWTSANINRDNMTNDCGHRPLDCLLFRNRSGECTVMTKLDNCSGVVRLENGWSGDSIILSLKSNTITKFSSNSINSNQLTSIDTGLAQLEENAIMNCNALIDIKLAILNNNLSVQFASNCFNGLPAEGTITIGKTADVTLTDDEITSFFRTIVGEGWTITIK